MIVDVEPRHKYEYAVDPAADTAPARVVRMVGTGKEVLEIGSGPGSITRVLHDLNHCRITALEIDPEALEKVAPFCVRALPADLNNPQWPSLLHGAQFDVVVAADVLEHLYDPLAALIAMKHLINDHGAVVISLPHVGHAALVGCLLDEDFEYRDWGLLDRTHIRFFGIKNIQSLFENAGLKIVSAEFVIRHPDVTEFAHRWLTLSEEVRRVALSNPFGMVYQVVIKAVPVDFPGSSIILLDLASEARGQNIAATPKPPILKEELRGLIRKYLSAQTRQSIRNRLGRLGIRV